MLLKKLNLYTILNLVIFCILTIIASKIFIYSTLRPDQLYGDIEPDNFFSYSDHGNYIVTLINRMLNFTIPYHLGIHVNDFQPILFIRILRGAIITSIAYVLSLIAFVKVKKQFLQPLLFILMFLGVIFVFYQVDFWPLECLTGFGRFIIADLFFTLFVFCLLNIIFSEPDEVSAGKQVILAFLALIVGNISEVLSSITFIALLLIFCINKIEKIKFTNSRFILLPLIFVCIGGALMFFNPTYQHAAKYHTGIITLSTVMDGINDYINFFGIYYQEIIKRHSYFFLFFLCMIPFFVYKPDNYRRAAVAISFLIAYLSFFVTFIISKGIIPSELYNDEYAKYWLNHHDFYHIISLFLFVILMILCSNIMKYMEDKPVLQYSLAIMFLICICMNFKITESINSFSARQKIAREYIYTIDKIVILNNKNKTKLYLFLDEKVPVQALNIIKEGLAYYYYKKEYNINLDYNNIIFVPKEEALKKFYDDGGFFIEDELENLKFQKLFLYKKEIGA